LSGRVRENEFCKVVGTLRAHCVSTAYMTVEFSSVEPVTFLSMNLIP